MDEMKNAALKYLDWGFSIIPCKGKHPLIKWGEYAKRQPSEDEVEQWWGQWPEANIALVTGHVSGVAAIDLDSQEAIKWAKDHLSDCKPNAWQKTTKGRHLLYQTNGTPIPNAVRIAEGVDVRGDGGYIIIDPSRHPDSGQRYEIHFAPDCDWGDLTVFPADKLPKREAPNDKPEIKLEPVGEGERNDTLARIAGRYFGRGMEYAEVLTLCKGWNADLSNPIAPKELEKTVASIWKKHQQNHPFERPEISEQSISKHDKASQSNSKQGQSGSNHEQADNKANQHLPETAPLSKLIEDWVRSNEGKFTTYQIDSEFNLKTRAEKNNRSFVLNRLAKQGLIRKDGQRSGQWRIVARDCEAMDVFGSGVEKLQIPLPLGLSGMVNVYPGSIVVVAGTSNSGKSAFVSNFAFSCYAYLSTLREEYNIYSIPACLSKQGQKKPETFAEYFAPYMDPKAQEAEVHYFNSEMAAPELRDRLEQFPGGAEAFRKVHFWKRSSDFADAIRPNGVNIIDFMECYDEFWKIGQWINEIHKELNRGIAIVVLQKKHGAATGRGGELTMEKPRLYLNLESNAPHGGICKIVKAKSFADPKDNPNGKEIDFKLIDGWKFVPISEWRHVDEKERDKINRKYKKDAGGESQYAFEFRTKEGEIVGLNFKDLEKWKQAYPEIDVEYELSIIARNSKSGKFLESKNWFHQVSGILKKKNKALGETDEAPF
jgi:hypothetical protein